MRAAQIAGYQRDGHDVSVVDVPTPEPGPADVLVRVRAAAVNPVDLLVLSGSLRPIQGYRMPLTLGSECAGVVEGVGAGVKGLSVGDKVYARLPSPTLGGLAERVVAPASAVAPMPEGMDFATAAAIPLTGLTAYQAIQECLEAREGQSVLITGGSGSFGFVAVPVAQSLGLRVTVTGNARSRDAILAAGAERYVTYTEQDYWDALEEPVDHVIDTLGPRELSHELSVLRPGGTLASLRMGPNRAFADAVGAGPAKRVLFSLAGARLDRAARRHGARYRFVFVRADGRQLREVTRIVERLHVKPPVDPHEFTLEDAQAALDLLASGRAAGKVVVRMG